MKKNFKKEIRHLKKEKNNTKSITTQDQWRTININNTIFMAINLNEQLGRGGFANVYKAYYIDPKTAEPYIDMPFVAKMIRADRFDENEVKFTSRYYKSLVSETIDGKRYLFAEFLEGQDLTVFEIGEDNVKREMKHPEIKKFDFFQHIDLIAQITLYINSFHHNTPHTGGALIHRDLKGSNIRFKIDDQSQKIHVFVLDLGLAIEADGDPTITTENIKAGTRLYLSPEALKNLNLERKNGLRDVWLSEFGLKSDIYAFAAIIALLLGATDPFKNKRTGDDRDLFNDFDFSGIFSNPKIPIGMEWVESVILKLLNRMQSEYENRPDSDELLRFFVTLKNACNIYKNNKQDTEIESLVITKSKLILLASGFLEVEKQIENDYIANNLSIFEKIIQFNENNLNNAEMNVLLNLFIPHAEHDKKIELLAYLDKDNDTFLRSGYKKENISPHNFFGIPFEEIQAEKPECFKTLDIQDSSINGFTKK